MVLLDHLRAEEGEYSHQAVADHRGADVPHVHRLGHIRRREIDHNRLRLRHRRHPQAGIIEHRARARRVIRRLDAEVDETRPGNLRRRHLILAELLQHPARERAGIHARLLREHHGGIALVITEAEVLRRRHGCLEIGGQRIAEHGGDGLGQLVGK